MTDFFPFGTQYHRAPTPLPEEWPGDLREIAAVGYTHVQFRPQWRWHERVRGGYTFDDLDRLFDLAAQNELRVVLKPMLETAPDWVFQELGGTRIGFHGVPISPVAIGSFYVGGWLPCFDNPQVMEAAAAFVDRLVRRYREHSALWFYDAWNEPRSRPLGQCHCDHSVRSYQAWLGERFGSVEEINARFGKAWTSLESIRPPASAGDYTEMFLWRQWAAQAVAHHVDATVNAIRQADSSRTVLAHVGFCSVAQDAVCDSSDDLLTAATADRYGTSYPVNLWPTAPIHHAEGDLISDWLRRVDPEYWCHEFYPNEANWCEPPDPATLDRLVWMALAGGTAGFTFWQFRSERLGNESNGWGMREIDGTPTARSAVCDRIAGVLREHGHKLAGTRRPRSRIAILYSRESDLLSRVEVVGQQQVDIALTVPSTDYPYKRMLRACHHAYQALGHTTDFAVPLDPLDDYDVLHITAMEMVSEQAAGWLRAFVQRGGHLVIEYPFACRDDNAWVALARPTHRLAELLGCQEASRSAVKPGQDRRLKLAGGGSLSASGWRVTFNLTGGEPIGWWEDESVAAVRHRYGKGVVTTFGTSICGSAADRTQDDALKSLHRGLMAADVVPVCEAEPGVWVRTREGEHRQIWFVFNVNTHVAGVTLQTPPQQVWHASVGAALEDHRLTLPPNSVWVAEYLRSAPVGQAKPVEA